MNYPIGKVARLSGVTVRTLRHYDEIGLLTPCGRTTAGYREYSDADLDRLRRILSYRELGFCLDDIAKILSEGDASTHLRSQHELLTRQIGHLQRVLAAVELELEAEKLGLALTQDEKYELFGDFDPEDYAEEAERRWGGTDAWKQSQQRTQSYTKTDWERITAEASDIERRLAAALREGIDSDSERAMDLADEHRQHITRWYYDCSHEIHRCLADMYVGDERFTAHYEKVESGLARFLSEAIHANVARAGA